MKPEHQTGDVLLPEGWTWKDVETARAKWGIADDMVPVAVAPGCVAWGTINSMNKEAQSNG